MKDYSKALRENRNTQRYKPDKPLFVIVRDRMNLSELINGGLLVENISRSGLCLSMHAHISSTSELEISLKSDYKSTAYFPARVVWQKDGINSETTDKSIEVGIEFRSSKNHKDNVDEFLSDISSEFKSVHSLEKALNSQICSKCVITADVPGAKFDNENICNFCRDYELKEAPIQRSLDYKLLEQQLLNKLKVNPKRHPYDCLCLYSGGKDSTYMLHLLVNKFKLRVLAFTFDNYFIAPETLQNMKKVLSRLNVDHILFKPSWESNKNIFRTGMIHSDKLDSSKELSFMIGHACWPCFTQISMHSIKLAVDKNIPNIVVGTTPGQIRQKKYDLVSKFNGLVDVYKTMVLPMMHLLKITGQNSLKKNLEISLWKQLKVLRMTLVPFYEYVYYNEALVIDTVKRDLGWEAPKSTDSCSTNCQLNSLGIQIHKEKHGISPYLIPLARDIREGLVDRGEALRAISTELNKAMVKNIASKFDVAVNL